MIEPNKPAELSGFIFPFSKTHLSANPAILKVSPVFPVQKQP
jgi:hypothetical protein